MASTDPTRLLVAALLFLLTWGTTGVAWAGCEKDTDCKGDRICEKGLCTDPNPGSGVTRAPPAIDRKVLREASGLRRRARGLAGAGWVFFGVGTLSGVMAIGFGVSDESEGAPIGLGAMATLMYGIGGPFAGSAGGVARQGVRVLGAKPMSIGPRAVAWPLYGVALGLGVAATGLSVAEDDSYVGTALGGVGLSLGIASMLILLSDAAVHIRGIRAGLDAANRLSAAETRPRLRLVSMGPWMQPATPATPTSKAGIAATFVW